jgi:hypothetical protein
MLYNSQSDAPQVRHRCRNPHCGASLSPPAADKRNAFCCKACETGFYRSRCRVCESLFSPRTKRRQVCWRSRCRHELQRHPEQYFGSRPNAALGHNEEENPAKSAKSCCPLRRAPAGHNEEKNLAKSSLKNGTKSDRALRHVAGPEGHEINYRILPEVPDGKANKKFWLEAERRAVAAGTILFTRDTPPLNVIGGYTWPNAPAIDLSPPPAPAPIAPIAPATPAIGDGLDGVPAFLKRTVPAAPATADHATKEAC